MFLNSIASCILNLYGKKQLLKKDKTLFEQILSGDLPGYIPFQTEKSAVIISLEGHPLVISKEPYQNIYELPDDVAADIMQVAVRVAKAVKNVTKCEGVNLVQSNGPIAGQDVFHFHLHIKPRFIDDSTHLSWNTHTKPDKERAELSEKLVHLLQE